MNKYDGPKLCKEYDEETRKMFNKLVKDSKKNNYHERYTTEDIKRMIGWMLRRRPDNFAKLDNMRFLYKTYHMCDMEEGLKQRLHAKREKMMAHKKVRLNVVEEEKEEEEKEEEEKEEEEDGVSCTMSEAELGEFVNFDENMHDYHKIAKYCTFHEMRAYLRHFIGNPDNGYESEYESEEELDHNKGILNQV